MKEEQENNSEPEEQKICHYNDVRWDFKQSLKSTSTAKSAYNYLNGAELRGAFFN